MSKKQEEIKVMEDKGAWIFTDDQIYKIKMQNKIAIRNFFEDNYNLILMIAKKFRRKRIDLYGYYNYSVNDLVNQVYVDLCHYRFDSRIHLYKDIVKGSMLYIDVGGIKANQYCLISGFKIKSLETPLTSDDEDLTLAKVITNGKSVEDIYINNQESREEKDKKILEYLEKTMPNKKELNLMFCQLFTDIPICEIQGDEYEQYIRKSFQCESEDNGK